MSRVGLRQKKLEKANDGRAPLLELDESRSNAGLGCVYASHHLDLGAEPHAPKFVRLEFHPEPFPQG